jgi:hypothetical protein
VRPRKSKAKYTVEGQRQRWLALRDANPGKNGRQLRALNGALSDWLYRRDRDWLSANVPRIPRPPAHAVVDWDERDSFLGARVIRASMNIKSLPGKPRRVTIAAIARELRQNKSFRVNLDKLPLTRLAIQGVIENNEHFSLRRISYVTQQLIAADTRIKRCEFIRRAGLRVERLQLPTIQSAVDSALLNVGINRD